MGRHDKEAGGLVVVAVHTTWNAASVRRGRSQGSRAQPASVARPQPGPARHRHHARRPNGSHDDVLRQSGMERGRCSKRGRSRSGAAKPRRIARKQCISGASLGRGRGLPGPARCGAVAAPEGLQAVCSIGARVLARRAVKSHGHSLGHCGVELFPATPALWRGVRGSMQASWAVARGALESCVVSDFADTRPWHAAAALTFCRWLK